MQTDARTDARSETWHCPCPADKDLVNLLVRILTANVWVRLSKHFNTGYPLSVADKYDLVYRLVGCKMIDGTVR